MRAGGRGFLLGRGWPQLRMRAEYSGGIASLKWHSERSLLKCNLWKISNHLGLQACAGLVNTPECCLLTTSLFSWVCCLNAVCETLKSHLNGSESKSLRHQDFRPKVVALIVWSFIERILYQEKLPINKQSVRFSVPVSLEKGYLTKEASLFPLRQGQSQIISSFLNL